MSFLSTPAVGAARAMSFLSTPAVRAARDGHAVDPCMSLSLPVAGMYPHREWSDDPPPRWLEVQILQETAIYPLNGGLVCRKSARLRPIFTNFPG